MQPRLINWDEVPHFREVGACGTATVCVPISSITEGEIKHEFGSFEVLQQAMCTLITPSKRCAR